MNKPSVIWSVSLLAISIVTIFITFHHKKRKKYECHFGKDDIRIDNTILNPIHILPKNQWRADQEIDFYMKDNGNYYLLRIINNDKYIMTLCDSGEINHIIVCVPINDTYTALEKIICQLKCFPYSKKLKHKQQTYRFVI